MARKSRIDATGALHYIIVQCIVRRSIYVDAQDYQNFLERSGHILKDFFKVKATVMSTFRHRYFPMCGSFGCGLWAAAVAPAATPPKIRPPTSRVVKVSINVITEGVTTIN